MKDEKFEYSYLELVIKHIKDQIKSITAKKKCLYKDIQIIKNKMWDEGPKTISDLDDAIELAQYNLVTDSYSNYYEFNDDKLNVLEKMVKSPYFGRIDFKEKDETECKEIYIGLNSIYDVDSCNYYVYDWRAPISSIYYNYNLGYAQYESPCGLIKGDIYLKRQYKIVNGNIDFMFDSDIKIDDDMLQRLLATKASNKLKVIINSIQKEQNKCIRYDQKQNNLIIFGPAGSGKTSIGLHRIAFLLYKFRGKLSSKDIKVFTQNKIFESYISNIIPELGEEDVVRVEFFELIKNYMNNTYKLLDIYEQIEYYRNANVYEPRFNGIKIKYSKDFIDFLDENLINITIKFSDVLYKGLTICSGDDLYLRFLEDKNNYTVEKKKQRILKYVENQIDNFIYFDQAEKLKEEFINYEDSNTKEFELYLKKVKEDILNDVYDKLKLDFIKIYMDLLTKYIDNKQLNKQIVLNTYSRIKNSVMTFEDSLVIFYIKLKLGEIAPNLSTKYILIDEAQDFNFLQHTILKKLYIKSKFTLLADVNQAIFSTITIQDKKDLISIYDNKNTKVIELNKSYRSTKEINDLASKLIQNNKIDYFVREGQKPIMYIRDDNICVIKKILSEECKNNNSTCIITESKLQCIELYNELKSQLKEEIKLIDCRKNTFKSGIIIMPVSLCKGLEFDTVIVPLNQSKYIDKKILYQMCTRALHHLYLIVPNKCSGMYHQLFKDALEYK